MASDTSHFRKALGAFTTGVTIITTRDHSGRDVGVTANSFNSVSLDPPLVLWSLARSASSFPAFAHTDYFAVHILAADQEHLSRQFAQRGAEKFVGVRVQRGLHELPLLEGCAARFECRTVHRYDGGDHKIYVGEVVSYLYNERPPLVFHSGTYATLRDKREAAVCEGGSYNFDGDISNDDQ
jgi:3-hydroxy-9,10-secoandrosta-1,3,5(10)-triene-9,17-dione monooxygenase reductase component